MDGQIDGQVNRSDFTGPLQQGWRLYDVFRNSRIRFLKLFALIVSHMEIINTRKGNTMNIVLSVQIVNPLVLKKVTHT